MSKNIETAIGFNFKCECCGLPIGFQCEVEKADIFATPPVSVVRVHQRLNWRQRLLGRFVRFLLRWGELQPFVNTESHQQQHDAYQNRTYLLREFLRQARQQDAIYEHADLVRTTAELQRCKLALAEACNENLRLRLEPQGQQ